MNQNFIDMNQNYLNDKLVVGYTPNNFFWVGVSDEFKKFNCSEVDVSNVNCSTITRANIKSCYHSQLCQNKKNATWIQNVQTTHSGSDKRYLDTKIEYNIELRKTFNLGIGVIGLLIFIYYNNK